MCGCFCIGFIDSLLKSKSLLDYTNLFPPNDCDKDHKVINKKMKKYTALFAVSMQSLKNLKYHTS